MPWKATDVETERLKFVAECEKREFPFTAVCEAAGISRKTGYKILHRYRTYGVDGLKDRSHAAHEHPNRTGREIEERLVQMRREHPRWGSRKLIALLKRESPELDWPAPSTATDILKRHGLVATDLRRRRLGLRSEPFGETRHSNDTWCADFKGWFRTRDGTRCDPLTLIDAMSRYSLACRIVSKTNLEHVWLVFEQAFREYGLPLALRSDNGPPFGSTAIGGLSKLGVRLTKLGIRIEHIEPGKPQQNGRQERFHLTLLKEAINPPRHTARQQQSSLDRFVEEYNHVRPHEAIDFARPAEIYRASPRPFPGCLPAIVYSGRVHIRNVRRNGTIKWRGREIFVSATLIGEPIALAEVSDRLFEIQLGPVRLGLLSDEHLRVLPYRRLTYTPSWGANASAEPHE
ncbi:MAG: IS481 family transposase [Planctomycetes bacterium]|nr:IS481 family transposase [Planctomycetota bacterium]